MTLAISVSIVNFEQVNADWDIFTRVWDALRDELPIV